MANVPLWAAVNELDGAEFLRVQALSGGQPNPPGVSLANEAFPESQLYDGRPGTVCRAAAMAPRAIVARFPSALAVNGVAVINHNLPTDAELTLMASATGAAGTWAEVADLTALLAHASFHKVFANASHLWWALVNPVTGSLVDPWEVGEWWLFTKRLLPVGFRFDAVPRGRLGRNIRADGAYGTLGAKHFNSSQVFEGTIGGGVTAAELDDLEALITETSHGAAPFLWVNDSDSPKAVIARGENFEEWMPPLLTVSEGEDRFGDVRLRIVEVPYGRTAA